jgi:hypothetical protein
MFLKVRPLMTASGESAWRAYPAARRQAIRVRVAVRRALDMKGSNEEVSRGCNA